LRADLPASIFVSNILKSFAFLVLLIGCGGSMRAAPAGTLDAQFQAALDPKAVIEALVVAPDGSVYVSGDALATVGGTSRDVVHLLANGALDTGFVANLGAYSHTIQLDGAGRLLVWSTYHVTNPASTPGRPLPPIRYDGLARLNADGAWDSSFTPATGSAGRASVAFNGIAADEAGRIGLMGAFYLPGGSGFQYVARLLESGAVDARFVPAATPQWHYDQRFESLNPNDGGMVVIGGSIFRYADDGALVFSSADEGFLSGFITADGSIVAASATAVKRFLEDGTPDSAFAEFTGASGIVQIAQGPAGTIVVVGANGVVRLNANGTPDPTFQAPALSWLRTVAVDALGNIFTGPYFGTVNGTAVNGIARLNGGFDSAVTIDPIAAADESTGGRIVTLRRLGDRTTGGNTSLFTGFGSATPDVDFGSVSRDVAFEPGQETATVEIPIIDDAEIEPAEIFPVWLGGGTLVEGATARRGIALTAESGEKASADAYAGTYRGLYEVNGAPGVLTVRLTRGGSITGTLRTRRGSFAVHGTFNGAGRVSLTIDRGEAPRIVRETLYLSGAGAARTLTGLQGSSPLTLSALAAANAPAGAVGSYTFTLPPRSSTSEPQSQAWASAHVLPTGGVTVVGRLPDGSAFTTGGRISSDAQCTLFTPLYAGRGSVCFDLAFTAAGDGAKLLTGDGVWTRVKTFDEHFTVSGSAFTRAAADALASQTLSYTRAGLAAPATLAPVPSIAGSLIFSDGNVLLRLARDGRFTGQEGRGKSAIFFSGIWLALDAYGAGTTVGATKQDVLVTPAK
jgi:hypothetical protein